MTMNYTCPCCGYREFKKPPGSGESCTFCLWIDDALQFANPTAAGGLNKESLLVAQDAFRSTMPLADIEEAEAAGASKDPAWRALNMCEREIFESESRGVAFVNPPVTRLSEAYWNRNIVEEKTRPNQSAT